MSFKHISVHDYSTDHIVRTRNDSNHDTCPLCKVARKTLDSFRIPSRKNAQHTKHEQAKKVLNICSSCLTQIAPGKRHSCSKKAKIQNLLDISGNAQVLFVAKAIRDKNSACNNTIELPNVHGKRTRLTVNQPASTRNQFTHQDMLHMKADLNLSITKVCMLHIGVL